MVKRKKDEIRNSIQNALKERPMELWELTQHTDTDVITLKKHLNYLITLGIIEKKDLIFEDKKAIIYQLVHGQKKIPEIKMHHNLWKALGLKGESK